MLGDSAVLGTAGGGSSGGDAAVASAAAARAHDGADTAAGGGGGGSNSGDDERGDRSFGGNRWPRQETLALLKIRSDMDVAFRDASVKGPLWEDVSRKLAELGFHRNAKKCKEKFENVYKYHKRTKEGRSGKSDGKTYRFFDQLQALENNPAIQSPTTSKPPQQQPAILSPTPLKPPQQIAPPATTPVALVATTPALSSLPIPTTTVSLPLPPPLVNTIPGTTTITVPSTPMPQGQGILNLTVPSYPSFFPPSTTNPPPHTTITPPSFPNIPTDFFSDSSSSSMSSEETTLEAGTRKRKRKWKDFFERLMKEVMEKQEQLQKRFLEAIEKREQERVAREEAWKVQEMQRINREREILAQERSIAAAKDAAVMAFLQKIAEQQNLTPTSNNNTPQQQPQETVPAPPAPAPVPVQTPTAVVQQITAPVPQPPQSLAPQEVPQQHQVVTNLEMIKGDNGESVMPASSSRWPKAEVEALIKLRTNLDTKYQDSGPKGPLWEEISALMRKMGYNRNAKRCKEKWENINKYFKKVKESNKKRPEDAKTCPYFHQLDALYREKSKMESSLMKPDESAAAAAAMMAPLMVRPEQQWPPQPAAPELTMGEAGNEQRHSEEEDYDEDNDYDDDKDVGDEDEDDEGSGKYEVVASKPTPR